MEAAGLAARLTWVAAAAVASHATALAGGFVWLDRAHLMAGLAVRPRGSWLELIREPFAGTGFYRPLTALSLSIDAAWGHPALFHAVNLGLHAVAALLLLLAAQALGTSRRAATLGALLFAVHPVGSLVAGAIAFRSESLIACGLFGLVAAHVRGRWALAALAVLVAGLSKETGLALAPLFVAVLELDRRARRRWPVIGAEALAFGLAVGLRIAYAPPWLGRFPELGASEAVGTRLAALAKSSSFVVAPFDRSICDAFPITSALAPLALVGALIALGLCAMAWRGGSLGALSALAVLPSLHLVPTLRWWSPHYLYVAAGFFLVLVARQLERRGAGAMTLALGAGLVMGVLSSSDGRRYRSDDTLWRPEVTREPACREGHFYLAEAARERGDSATAATHYEAALGSRAGMLAFVDLDATLTNYGVVLFSLHRYDEARAAFEGALEHVSDERGRRRLNHDVATAMLASGDARGAAARLEPEVRRSDALAESLVVYARALDALGRGAEADAIRRRAAPR